MCRDQISSKQRRQATVQAPSVCGVGARGQEEYKESERSLAASAASASGNDFFWSVAVGTEQVCMFKGNCNGRETEALTEFGEYGWKIRQ